MQLVTKTLEKVFEKFPLYSQDGKPINEKKVLCKFFTPWGANTWIVTEASRNEETPGDWDFFGVVTLGYGWEWGYFSLSELQGIRGQFGLGVEREKFFKNGKVSVYDALKQEGSAGAEAAERMLKYERDKEQPEPDQPETEEAETEPENLPHIMPDGLEPFLRRLAYSAEDAKQLYESAGPEIHIATRAMIMRPIKARHWCISDQELCMLAKCFIKAVQDWDAMRVVYVYDYLEECNFHAETRDFMAGNAAKYIPENETPDAIFNQIWNTIHLVTGSNAPLALLDD